jgi:magnesium-transporting ATPase (P-type)
LKVFSIAYKDVTIDDLFKIPYNPESDEFRKVVESDLVYMCTFGFNDELREDA